MHRLLKETKTATAHCAQQRSLQAVSGVRSRYKAVCESAAEFSVCDFEDAHAHLLAVGVHPDDILSIARDSVIPRGKARQRRHGSYLGPAGPVR